MKPIVKVRGVGFRPFNSEAKLDVFRIADSELFVDAVCVEDVAKLYGYAVDELVVDLESVCHKSLMIEQKGKHYVSINALMSGVCILCLVKKKKVYSQICCDVFYSASQYCLV